MVSVLANDTDADGDALTVVGASDGLYGTTAVNSNGTITYTPNADFNGADVFVYVIDDGHGRFSLATVTVTVNAVNDAPAQTGTNAYTALAAGVLTIAPGDSYTDVDGDPLTVTGVTQGTNGTVTFTPTGVTYTPFPGFTGGDTFTYTIDDGYGGVVVVPVVVTVATRPSVGGGAWLDANEDGLWGADESGVTGVTVQLFDADGNVVATTGTGGDGLFLFASLNPGRYRIRVLPPIGYSLAPGGGIDAGGYTESFTLGAGDTSNVFAALKFGLVADDEEAGGGD